MTRIEKLKTSLTQFPDIPAPSKLLFALELRAVWECMVGWSMYAPLRVTLPKGDGHPVLVIPGLGTTDLSTAFLRQLLRDLGYRTYPWGMGRNLAMKDELTDDMVEHLERIHRRHNKKVSIIGQSLGGVYARELGKERPELVRQVITLGSPFTGHPLASTGVWLYEALSGENFEYADFDRHLDIRVKPPVPSTSIYSKMDGVVAWQCSIEKEHPESENIHIRGNSHCGMGFNPISLFAITNRLAQAENDWKPFNPSWIGKLLYGTKDHQTT